MFLNPESYNQNSELQKQIARDLVNFVIQNFKFEPNSHIKCLDIGCGTGFVGQSLLKQNPNIELWQIDSSKAMCDFAKKISQNTLQHNIQNPLPFPPESFDVITSSMTLQWISQHDTHNVIRSITSNLKQDGVFIFAVPLDSSLNELQKAFQKCNLPSPIVPFPRYENILHTREYTEHGTILQILKRMNKIGAKNKNYHHHLSNMNFKMLEAKFSGQVTWQIGFAKYINNQI